MPSNVPIIKFSETELDFGRNLIDGYELLLVPLYWLLLTKLALYILKRYEIKDLKLAKVALHVKFLGSIIANLIYCLYYKGGDSNAYFNDGWLLNRIICEHPTTGLKLLFTSEFRNYSDGPISSIVDQFRYTSDDETWIVCKFSAIFQFFTFRSILVTGMLFSFSSFFCSWVFYEKIKELSPAIKKYAFWAIFFIPSVVLWGSGIFKDTICISALFLLFTGAHETIFKRKSILFWVLVMTYCTYLIFIIKNYILFSFAICFILWIVASFVKRILGINKAFVVKAGLLMLIILATIYPLQKLVTLFQEDFFVQSMVEGAVKNGASIKKQYNASDAFYDIGDIEPTINGIIKISFSASNVSLFRPYLWEVKNFMLLISALQSTVFILLAFYVLWKVNLLVIFQTVFTNPLLLFCISFCFLISVIVGVASFNFGALDRYKIPCLPFFVISMFMILADNNKLPISSSPNPFEE
jgi:hypothetical protein